MEAAGANQRPPTNPYETEPARPFQATQRGDGEINRHGGILQGVGDALARDVRAGSHATRNRDCIGVSHWIRLSLLGATCAGVTDDIMERSSERVGHK